MASTPVCRADHTPLSLSPRTREQPLGDPFASQCTNCRARAHLMGQRKSSLFFEHVYHGFFRAVRRVLSHGTSQKPQKSSKWAWKARMLTCGSLKGEVNHAPGIPRNEPWGPVKRFLLSFLLRYVGNIPKESFQPYKSNYIFLTLIYMSTLFFAGVFKKRFTAFSDLLKRIFVGLSFGTMFGISLIYVFRIIWTTFPSSIFVISFLIALFLIFTCNALILKLTGRIRKKIVQEKSKPSDNIINLNFK